MSILLREGFGNLSDGEHLTANREIFGQQWLAKHTTFDIVDRGDGRKWMTRASNGNPHITSGQWGAEAKLSVGVRKVRASGAQFKLCNLYAADGTFVLSLGINTNGTLCVARDSNRLNNQTAISTGAVPTLTETYVEYEIETFTYTATSTVRFFINGVLDSEFTNVQTAASSGTYSPAYLILVPTSSETYRGLGSGKTISDLVVHNEVSPLGDVGVHYFPVDGDDGTPDFTPSAVGANTLMLDEIGPDEDTTYNESNGTAGHRDQFSAPGLTGYTVLEVGTLVRARKTSTGTATLLLGMKENLTEDQSAAKALSEDYLTLLEGWATNPDTLAAWTAQQAIDALISYEVGA